MHDLRCKGSLVQRNCIRSGAGIYEFSYIFCAEICKTISCTILQKISGHVSLLDFYVSHLCLPRKYFALLQT